MSASEKPLRHQGDSLYQPSAVDYREHNLAGVPSVYFESPHVGRQTIGAIAIFASREGSARSDYVGATVKPT